LSPSSGPVSIPPPPLSPCPVSITSPDAFVPYSEFPVNSKPCSDFSPFAYSPDDIYCGDSAQQNYSDSDYVTPSATTQSIPIWDSRLWDPPVAPSSRETSPLFGDDYSTKRPFPMQKSSPPIPQVFLSSSAPSVTHIRERTPSLARRFSRRAESFSENDDRDATIRRPKRAQLADSFCVLL
jgi:hypothetical protein